MITVASLLVRGLGLTYAGEPLVKATSGTLCIVCGELVSEGYPADRIISKATTEYLDQFRGNPSGMVCHTCATCYKNNAPRAGMPTSRACMVFADGTYYHPLISTDSAATQERACWSDLVRDVWPHRAGQEVLVILTTDWKKRLWPGARVGALGINTPVYVHDGAMCTSGVYFVHWPRLIDALDLVEMVYSAGFVKQAIMGNLYTNSNVMQEVGIVQTAEWERMLRDWRGSIEFDIATLVAQKREES